jgi:CBS domain containing-hemolysin-like protein
LRALVEHSANVGALEASYSASITRALTLADITLQDMVAADAHVTAVSGSATIADVQERDPAQWSLARLGARRRRRARESCTSGTP